MTRPDFVTSRDGLRVAVYADGDPAAPTVLAVHGYPDSAAVWDGVASGLADRYRVVRYDVRGAGRSGVPRDREGYLLERLIADVEAVLGASARPVHLLGHDLGSVQGWRFVCTPELAGRFASFTSISGPCIEQLRPWATAQLARRRLRPVVGQLTSSSYIPLFRLPLLPELAWRSGLPHRLIRRREPGGASSLADALAGLQLYRGDLLRGAGPPGRIGVPVQVIAPDRDPYVRADLQLQAPLPWVDSYFARRVEGGHWIVRTDPALVAGLVADLVEHVERGAPMPVAADAAG
jgi:pimeloyl-ACP methyl ester carboxylesterase